MRSGRAAGAETPSNIFQESFLLTHGTPTALAPVSSPSSSSVKAHVIILRIHSQIQTPVLQSYFNL